MKRLLCVLIALGMGAMWIGCAPPAKRLTATSFEHETSGFALPGIPWGSSPETLDASPEYSLGSLLGESEGTDSGGHTHRMATYASDKLLDVEGNAGMITYEFYDDELVSVGITFRTDRTGMEENDLAALYDTFAQRAEDAFGDPAFQQDDVTVKPHTDIEGMADFVVTSRGWIRDGDLGETRLVIAKERVHPSAEIEMVSLMVSNTGDHIAP